MRFFSSRRWQHSLLLLIWLAIGLSLRFTHLAAKPPWNDELATLVFSLGNSLRTVPIDQVISLDILLEPLRPSPQAGLQDVIAHLMTESTHPPVYFALTHLWLKLFPSNDGLVSVWAARSLSALLGTAAIPASFGLGWLAFRSRTVGQLSAAMMAVSPYGIYLSQEARHYTLAILLIIASLSCLMVAVRSLHQQKPLPLWIGLGWVAINSLGVAVHYFFALTLAAETLVLAKAWVTAAWTGRKFPDASWRRIYAVALGTLIGACVWLPAWQQLSDNELTQWIYAHNFLSSWMLPIARLIAWMITMLAMLPIEGTPRTMTITSGTVLILFSIWVLLLIIQSIKIQLQQPDSRQNIQMVGGYLAASIALFFSIIWGRGADLTIAARYQFVYFPAVIVLMGSVLTVYWHPQPTRSEGQQVRIRGKLVVALILLMGFMGGLTVVENFGYEKPDRPDLLVPIIQQFSQAPALIATTHETHEQTRELMGLALEFKRVAQQTNDSPIPQPLFLLANLEAANTRTAIATLEGAIAPLPRPLDIWLVNFLPSAAPAIKGCDWDTAYRPVLNGYKHRLYRCKAIALTKSLT